MRINGINNVNGVYNSSGKRKSTESSGVSSGKDSLNVSDFAKELQVATKAVNNSPDVRQDKIDAIKEQMEAGTYNVTASMVADKLVDNTFE
jgi:negative regulator of flagellin synthesis FlgM